MKNTIRGLMLSLSLLLLSCSKDKWVCTCEQEKTIQECGEPFWCYHLPY